jgi:hypothetical protein
MNTLTDAGSIRSRITAGLASNGDVNRTVSTAKGGLGADFSGTATGFIRIINGTAAQRAYADAKSDMSLDNVPNVDTRDLDNMNAGTLAIARGGTNAGNSNDWLNTRVKMQTDGTLEYDNTTDGAVTMNTLADDNNIRARITGSLESANGLKSGIAIGDAVQTAIIYSGQETTARVANDETITNSLVWEQDDTTEVIKITFNYLHNANNRGLKLSCLLRSANPTYEARAKLSVYPNTVSGSFVSGSLPDTSSTAIASVVLATDKQYFDSTHTSSMLGLTTASGTPGTGEVADGTLYKVTIGLYNENASVSSFMSAPTVTVFGSSS